MIELVAKVVDAKFSLMSSFLRLQGCLINLKLQIYLDFVSAIN